MGCKSTCRVLAACLTVLLWSGAALAQTKIAVVNSRDILTKCQAGAQAIAAIQAKFANRRQELTDLERKTRALQDEARASGATAAKKKEFQSAMLSLRDKTQKLQQDVAQEEKERFKPILEQVNAALLAYAKENDLSGIQDRSQYLYILPSLDITEAIIKRLDRQP